MQKACPNGQCINRIYMPEACPYVEPICKLVERCCDKVCQEY